MRYPNLMSKKRALYSSAAVWFICVLVSCLSHWKRSYVVFAVPIAICFFTPTFSYIRIYRIVRQPQRHICMILCYSSMFTFMLIDATSPILRPRKWSLGNTMVFMNSSINPIFYILLASSRASNGSLKGIARYVMWTNGGTLN